MHACLFHCTLTLIIPSCGSTCRYKPYSVKFINLLNICTFVGAEHLPLVKVWKGDLHVLYWSINSYLIKRRRKTKEGKGRNEGRRGKKKKERSSIQKKLEKQREAYTTLHMYTTAYIHPVSSLSLSLFPLTSSFLLHPRSGLPVSAFIVSVSRPISLPTRAGGGERRGKREGGR